MNFSKNNNTYTETETETVLDNQGYILLTNILNNNELDIGLSSIEDNKVDYSVVKNFIDNIFFKKIKENSTVITDPYYVKFRLSNNNNSTDASTFHGDIYNNTNETVKIVPLNTKVYIGGYFAYSIINNIPLNSIDVFKRNNHNKFNKKLYPQTFLLFN